MRILIVSDAWKPQVNGVVRTYEYLIEELEKMNHDVRVIGPADFPYRTPMPGYSEIELVIMPYRRLSRMTSDYRPDHIHIATEGPLGRATRKYCLKHHTGYTTAYHSQFPDYIAKRVGKFLPFLYGVVKNQAIKSLRRFHNDADAVMVSTQSLEDQLRVWQFNAPMHRLTRGVDSIFKPDGPKTFEDLPQPVALYVGRVAMEKNLDAFLSMEWDGSKVIIGHGPSEKELREKYPNAHFAGKKEKEELAACYRSSDVFVFPSKTDTFGMVITEALASGLPVAAYDVMGPRDLITEPCLGYLHEDLSHAAKQALTHNSTAEDRYNHIKKHYSWPIAAKQFVEIIENTIQNRNA